MSASLSVFKTLFAPAIAALILFLAINFAVVPAWQFYRNRYSHFFAVGQISTQTVSLGHRLHQAVGNFFTRVDEWRERRRASSRAVAGSRSFAGRVRAMLGRGHGETEASNGLLSEEGEELGAIPTTAPPAYEDVAGSTYGARRLSQELEDGFMEDSDDDDDDPRQRR